MTPRRAASAGGSLAALLVAASGLACSVSADRVLRTALAASAVGAVLGGLAGPRLLREDAPSGTPPQTAERKGD